MSLLQLPDPARLLPEPWQPYARWLACQANPSLAYAEHAHLAAADTDALKQAFRQHTGMDLDDYIRLRRIAFLLSRSQAHSQYRGELAVGVMDSPFGEMLAVCGEKGLCLLKFVAQKGVESELLAVQREKQALFAWRETPLIARLRDELAQYFQGTLRAFSTDLDFIGNDTQRQMWQLMTTIGYGETRSYAQLAAQTDKPNAARHIAAAAGQNKIAIVVPCHRVSGYDHISSFADALREHEATTSAPAAAENGFENAVLPPPTGLGWRKS
ncbi:methylated-DNA--[protein]-cysteine S-methyltransferase [Conchiformibius kuhniae]|uniref:Methylated-DNA--[protein]-cysteine S-methyltransferase n=1 Tax=Conchiformibius kuhniae TaxID=211502 RepID=A0A8T9MWT7_9NEIS|nr:methylated-DNA--[protein]-cysteine S-methyltransferase [Conchiformibius kuhniae]